MGLRVLLGGSRTPLTGETESVEAGRQAGGAARVDLETGMLTVRTASEAVKIRR